jgi:flagellar hook-length control protein FliK
MSSDSAINRIPTTDPNDALNKRKSKGEQINVSQASFFNELLNLSKFECKVVEPSEQPLPSLPATPATAKKSNDESVESAKEPAEKEVEAESDSDVDAEVYAAQLACQQNAISNDSADVQQDQAKPATEIVETTAVGPTSDEGQVDSSVTASVNTTQNIDSQSDQPVDSGVQEAVPLASDDNLAKTKKQVSADADQPQVASEKSEHVVHANEHESRRNSKRESQANEVRGSQEKRSSQADAKAESVAGSTNQRAKPKDGQQEVKQVKSDSNVADTEVEATGELGEVRNRRAERLAQRTQSDSKSGDERDSSESETSEAQVVAEVFKPAVAIEEKSVTLTTSTSDPITSMDANTSLEMATATGASNVTLAEVAKSAGDRAIVSSVSSAASAQGSSQTVTSTSSLSSATQSPTTQSASNGADSKPQVARPNSGTSISPYQEVKLVQRVLRGLEQLGDGGGQVKLRLHPPELGSLQLSLRMESGQMFAKLEVETTAARDTLLSNVQTLKDRLADQGIKVESFDVQLSTDSSGSGSSGSSLQQNGNPNANSSWENATSRYAQANNNRLSSEPPPERAATQSWSRTNGALDLTV